MLAWVNKLATKTTAYRFLKLEEELPSFPDLNSEPSVVDIRHLFPLWLIERYVDGSSVNSFIINFTQAYYDWLYSKKGFSFGKYEIGEIPFLQLVDIDNCPTEYLEHFAFSYASGFPQSVFDYSGDLDDETLAYFRNFIKGIRDNFYQKKGTESSYEYFFRTLYGQQEWGEDAFIEYPKKYVLRLNGGRFPGWPENLPQPAEGEWAEGGGWPKDVWEALNPDQIDDNWAELDYDTLNHLGYSVLNVHVIQDS